MPTRRLKKKQRASQWINKQYLCVGQWLLNMRRDRNLENVTEPNENVSGLVSVEPDS